MPPLRHLADLALALALTDCTKYAGGLLLTTGPTQTNNRFPVPRSPSPQSASPSWPIVFAMITAQTLSQLGAFPSCRPSLPSP